MDSDILWPIEGETRNRGDCLVLLCNQSRHSFQLPSVHSSLFDPWHFTCHFQWAKESTLNLSFLLDLYLQRRTAWPATACKSWHLSWIGRVNATRCLPLSSFPPHHFGYCVNKQILILWFGSKLWRCKNKYIFFVGKMFKQCMFKLYYKHHISLHTS